MKRLTCMVLILAMVGCAPAVVPAPGPEETGFAPVGTGAADFLRTRARVLDAEVETLVKESASLEKRRDALALEAADYRSRALEAKRSPYMSASQRKAKYDFWTDIARERDRQIKACNSRLRAMTSQITFLKMKHETILREARQARNAVAPTPG